MTETSDQLSRIAGAGGDVISATGEKIGSIGEVYRDNDSGEPTWVTVKAGLFGSTESFVPLQGATFDGDDIVVAYDRALVKDSPRVAADGAITPEEESQLAAHYHLPGISMIGGLSGPADQSPAPGRTGESSDGAMTRSEEQLRVGVQRRATERVRVRKYIVTEEVTQTVMVRREELRIEREPIGAAGGVDTTGLDAGEESVEVVLYAERPVLHTEIVPVERVRVTKDVVTDQVSITEELRKERIDTDFEGNAAPGR